ncbi:hypothetical protein ACFFV7_39750 [Nonomuraea spiralis]|uniref:Uncharacterized protein n=1 Tax=Nonomuraea spiralis TaxID=46182 RepID=A0ABV5IS52_9ACTN|nr:hypothetical protein [Nonomuraea spiralis]GGT45066.1 hypothetical protein GCM10010176_105550 [Nonomuraea spiralis]
MQDLSTKAVLGRAALIGLVTGIPTAIIWVDMQGEELDGTVLPPAMFLLAIILGTVGARLARLPRWGVVGPVGGAAAWLLIGALAVLAPVPELFGPLPALVAPVYVVGGVVGFALSAWSLMSPLRWWAVALAVAVPLGSWGAAQYKPQILAWFDVRSLERSGVPLIAPAIQGYRLVHVDLNAAGQREPEPSTWLEYWRDATPSRGFSEIQVTVWPAAAGNPWDSCLAVTEDFGVPLRCKSLPGDRWVRTGAGSSWVTVFARSGDALIMLNGSSIAEADLVAALSTFRPISAVELAMAM